MASNVKKDLGPRFTEGDNFNGFDKIVHDMMMTNELVNGYGGYVVSYADTKDKENKSGLSFGGNQMDMSKNPESVVLFSDILKNAKNEKGEPIVPPDKIKVICGNKNSNLIKINQTPEQAFGKNLSVVNAALSSDYGMKEINKKYVETVKRDTAYIEKVISLIKNPAAKAFYSTDFGKALLYDYNNQFGLQIGKDGKFLNDFINGEFNGTQKTDFKLKTTYAAPTDHYGLAEHVKYLHGTEQWAKKPTMVDNRIVETVNLLYTKYRLCEENPMIKSGKRLAFFEDGDDLLSDLNDDVWFASDYAQDDLDYHWVMVNDLAEIYLFDPALFKSHLNYSWLENYYSYMEDFNYLDFVKSFDTPSSFSTLDYDFTNMYSNPYYLDPYDSNSYCNDNYLSFDGNYIFNENDLFGEKYYFDKNYTFPTDYPFDNDLTFTNNFNFNFDFDNDYISGVDYGFNTDYGFNNNYGFSNDYVFSNDYILSNDCTFNNNIFPLDYTFNGDSIFGGGYNIGGGYNCGSDYNWGGWL